MSNHNQNNLYGIMFMLINGVAVSALYTATKAINKHMNPTQVVFFYKLMVLLFMLPWIFRHGMNVLKTSNFKLHIVRGFCSIFGSLCFMYGIKYVDLINATAIGYLEQVLWAVIGVLYFKEKLSKFKLLAIVLSTIGALLVVYPQALMRIIEIIFNLHSDQSLSSESTFNFYYLFIFGGISFWALNVSVIKVLGNKAAKNDTQAFYVLIFSAIFSYPIAFIKWTNIQIGSVNLSIYPSEFINWSEIVITSEQWALLFFMALMYFIHVLAFFLSVKYADISTIMPFDYTRLIFTAVLGIIFVNSPMPTLSSYSGYILIVLSGLILMQSEYRQKKKQTALAKSKKLEIEIENV